jgi:hypothetical protein
LVVGVVLATEGCLLSVFLLRLLLLLLVVVVETLLR